MSKHIRSRIEPSDPDCVTIMCKLPNGILLRLFGERRTFHVKGPAKRYGRSVGGYALTPNIPRVFWLAWLEQNKAFDAVRNGLIFATKQG
jgi:hypothetical protein